MQEGPFVARCKIYEIQGPDPSRTAGALRCHRDAVSNPWSGRSSAAVTDGPTPSISTRNRAPGPAD